MVTTSQRPDPFRDVEPRPVVPRQNGMEITMKRFAIAVAGLTLAVGLTACAGQPTPTSQESSSQDSQSEEPSASEPNPSLDPSSGLDEDKGTEGMTITGKISSGVEMGCVMLEFEGTTYNLVGGDASTLTPGAEVEVTGTVNEGLMTTCQQGVPFEVDKVTVR